MRIGEALAKVDAARNRIAVDLLLVLVQENDVGGTSSCRELAQAPEHFLSVESYLGIRLRIFGRVKREDPDERHMEEASHGDRPLEAMDVRVE